jgi:CHASE3 domain sensor protein
VKKQKIDELEKQHAAGYARIPSQAEEFEEWEPEQVWLDYEGGEPEEAIQQTARTGGGTRVMEEALEQAAEIRQKLEGRNQSDSTQDVREDRQR